ncbi:tetratricopeptide repeat-containing sensor histidine kinase [Pedobacter sp. UBA5917]|uniref:ATP-binding protein n=1 Tax=Pedobacter sp. UBA5917 TaxID=1947061 RepID=UPI0025E3F799|nr:tetratricopeptide repeat-containing sensor histidine kinase [Pedobacter sp. UBA5917]
MKYCYLTLISILFLFSCSPNKTRKEKETINPYYDQAFDFREKKIPDSAFRYFSQAKDLFSQQKDSLGIAKCLVNMALISIDRGDYFGGQEFSLDALRYFKANDKRQFAYLESNLHELALASFHLKNYNQAIKYYNLSLKYAPDSISTLTTRNNIANAYRNKKEYAKSLTIYQDVLQQKNIGPEIYAMTLTNLASAKWEQNEKYKAVPELLEALQIRKRENDTWGQNSSYSHLADYYLKTHPDSALFYAIQMYDIAQKIKSPDNQIEALQKLIKLSPPKETKHYFSVYEKLNDSVQTARSAAKNQFALIRYETEKSKADNLVLQKDNDGKRYQIIILAIGIVLISVTGTILYKKRKQRIELEAQNSIRDNKLKTSQKVHDVVANGLYRIMSKLDNQETLKNNPIINEIEDLYEQSRDLSYEKPRLQSQPFHEKISGLLKTFASDDTKVIIVGNSAQLWEKVTEPAKHEIEHILQELMVNMDKHSQASDVVIKFEQAEQKINIYYTDNGVGISGQVQPNNGLTNTGTRIATIGGTITFDTNVEKGLKIQISFPVS